MAIDALVAPYVQRGDGRTRGRSGRRTGGADGAAGGCPRADGAGGAPDWAAAPTVGGGRCSPATPESAAGLGEAPSLGALSVPPNWLWSAAPPPPMMLLPAGVPLAAPDADSGAGLGFPFAFGGLPGAAAVGAAAGAGGAAASKFGSRLKVVARPPSAGYPAEPAASSPPGYPKPAAGYSTNGHAPPGYRPAIVYLPTNGHDPAHV